MISFVLGITGAHSGCGKTSLAEIILNRIPIPWGAVKYTHSDLYASLTDDPAVLREEGKDTALFLEAGARHVIWIQSPPEDLDELLPAAFGRLAGCRGIIVEGNSPAIHSSPGAIIFVYGEKRDELKPSARLLIERADYLVVPLDMSIKRKKNVYNKYSEKDMISLCDDISKKFKLREKGASR